MSYNSDLQDNNAELEEILASVNALPNAGSGNVIVAHFESPDGEATLFCKDYTYEQMKTALLQGIVVIAHCYLQSGWMSYFVNLDGHDGKTLNVGALGDYGWNHAPDDDYFFADGNMSNKTAGNELWFEF